MSTNNGFCKDNTPRGSMAPSKFRSAKGRYYTKALFIELCTTDRSTAIYTLKEDDFERDGVSYLSLKKLYLGCMDPIGYAFAEEYMGTWAQWQKVRVLQTMYANRSVAQRIADWEEELELKIRALATKSILDKSQGDGGFQAAKYLAQAGWKPSKSKGKEEAMKTKVAKSVENDAARLGLTLVK